MTDLHHKAYHRLPDTNLGNWREAPHSQWSFQNVRELIPSALIGASNTPLTYQRASSADTAALDSALDNKPDFTSLLLRSNTDSFVILRNGVKTWQWSAPHNDIHKPHIIFSISKSITAMLTGILVDQGVIDVDEKISHYLPGTRGSAYEDCSVQFLLDMSVALAFTEDYLNPDGDYYAYRNSTCWNPVDQTCGGLTLEPFLYSLKKAEFNHGEIFNYKSPNSDLLGLLLERASGVPFAQLLSNLLWQSMGAEYDGYVTVDQAMLARAAGGICVSVEDLARFGQLVLDRGAVGDRSVVPESWINDTMTSGDRTAWKKGDYISLLPDGCYRNKWYQIGNKDKCIAAIGIHGQWLYLNPSTQTVITRLSSQPDPVNDALDMEWLNVFEALSQDVV